MALSQFIFIVLTVIALSVGQILFKIASSSLEFSIAGILGGILNTKLIIALIVYFFATVMWLFVLKSTPLRIAYPFAALAFVIVPIFAHLFLGESLDWNTFAGAGIIAVGVWVSVYR